MSAAPEEPRVAYVISGFPLTFVTSEVDAHQQAGWSILPLSSSAPMPISHLSELERSWRKRTVYRPGIARMAVDVLMALCRHPIRSLAVLAFVFRLALASPSEAIKALYELGAAAHFAPRCRAFGANLVHVHFASRSLSLGLMLGILLDRPVTCTTHAFDLYTRPPRGLRFRLTRCAAVITISTFNRDYLAKVCGWDVAERTAVVHCGVDATRFPLLQRGPDARDIVSVTRLTPHKGLHIAIEACRVLRDRNVSATYRIVGDGEERADLQHRIREAGLSDRVRLEGARPNDQLLDVLAHSAIFVLPCVTLNNGDHDGIPVALMEAMATGMAVVSTPISGIPELIRHDESGLLVPERDPVALADALLRLLEDPALCARLGTGARQQIENAFCATQNAARLRGILAPFLAFQGSNSRRSTSAS